MLSKEKETTCSVRRPCHIPFDFIANHFVQHIVLQVLLSLMCATLWGLRPVFFLSFLPRAGYSVWAGAVPIAGTYGAIAGIGGCLGQLCLQMLLLSWDNTGHNTCALLRASWQLVDCSSWRTTSISYKLYPSGWVKVDVLKWVPRMERSWRETSSWKATTAPCSAGSFV